MPDFIDHLYIHTNRSMDFKSRESAGQMLAEALKKYSGAPKTIVIGLPRGGVVVAAEISKSLKLPLDVIIPRKIGAPHNEELAIGALCKDVVQIDQEIASMVGATPEYIEKAVAKERGEAERRLALYRKNKLPQDFSDWTVILIDDGIATGSTMQASIACLKKMDVKKIVVAIPVSPPDTLIKIKQSVDEVVCLFSTENFLAVGQFYEKFPQTSDNEVISLIERKEG